jgi:hypothetical protein
MSAVEEAFLTGVLRHKFVSEQHQHSDVMVHIYTYNATTMATVHSLSYSMSPADSREREVVGLYSTR